MPNLKTFQIAESFRLVKSRNFKTLAMKIIIFTLILVICQVSPLPQQSVSKVPVDEEIYDKIKTILTNKYPDDGKKVKCMDEKLRWNKVANDFYTPDLMDNDAALADAVEPYLKDVEEQCDSIKIAGYIVTAAFFVLGILICLVFCCCPDSCYSSFICCCCDRMTSQY